MTVYLVETRCAPPNSDLLHVTEIHNRSEAVRFARRIQGRVWIETSEDAGPIRRVLDLENEPAEQD